MANPGAFNAATAACVEMRQKVHVLEKSAELDFLDPDDGCKVERRS